MRTALVLLTLVTVSAFAAEFTTGGADVWKFNGYGIFRLDVWGEEDADPDMGFSAKGDIAWTPTLNEMLSAKVSLGLNAHNNGVTLGDAYLNMTPVDGFSIRGGQIKRMFGWGYLESTTAMLFPDRPLHTALSDSANIFGLYGKRDIGLMLLGDFDMFTLDVAYTNGVETEETDSNKQFTIHGTVKPTDWLTIGAALGMHTVDSGTDDTATGTGIDVYGLVKYPVTETIDLRFAGEYMMLGLPADDVEGFEINDNTIMTVAGGATFGLQSDMITAITPMIRYEQISPVSIVADGADDPEDNRGAIDFCSNFHMGSHNTVQIGIRNYSFQDENTDGYTDIILNWLMSF
ncbi:MAG TPA: porin [Candidatus Fermentibacter daniensis]|jgi:hypothetical protein|nr:MAG: hypothetical protein AO395_03865 [Candidatus Fermentibacter daniensis]MBP7719445.1 hypothetical protein [Candidatus Fermentibacter sp.]KZD18742.1 MAG: hypothetical protein AO396_00375 [Candidatus Fermentibacter daniensis]KZD20264.1 MAG: hypothetical protein AO394_00080 [Candidatus Fermentibacter daniensis]NLI01967.1 hypothetical protein [Candidatus Fermentibacter daniensis]